MSGNNGPLIWMDANGRLHLMDRSLTTSGVKLHVHDTAGRLVTEGMLNRMASVFQCR
ncbi:MAG: hypothetical protein M3R08_08655 [Bacteroidota bacterium]|nr:hypothetical protein [Bacteroidota bacterium]